MARVSLEANAETLDKLAASGIVIGAAGLGYCIGMALSHFNISIAGKTILDGNSAFKYSPLVAILAKSVEATSVKESGAEEVPWPQKGKESLGDFYTDLMRESKEKVYPSKVREPTPEEAERGVVTEHYVRQVG